jgi:hypothetical protein
MLHVLVGSNEDDYDAVVDAARKRGAVLGWVVPKTAAVGDRVLLFTRSRGFVAHASIATEGTPGEFGRKQVRRADVGPVVLFPNPVPLAYVTQVLSEWGWATYPRSYTTPPPSVADALVAALDHFQRDLGPSEIDQTDSFTEGRMRRELVVRYERDPMARAACIRHHGTTCAVCVFSYGGTYGPKSRG